MNCTETIKFILSSVLLFILCLTIWSAIDLVMGFDTAGVRLGEDINVTKAYEINDSLGIQYELVEKTNTLSQYNVFGIFGKGTVVHTHERRTLESYYYRGKLDYDGKPTIVIEKVGNLFVENTISYHPLNEIRLEGYVFEIVNVKEDGTLEGKWRITKESKMMRVNKTLSDTELKDVQHDYRIATDEGYWYFEGASKDVWAFRDYPQRVLITIRTSDANLSKDMEGGSWWIQKNKFDGLPAGDVQFATPDGQGLAYDLAEDVLIGKILGGARTDVWVVEGFTLYKEKDTQLYIYLKASCDPRYKYKELSFYGND